MLGRVDNAESKREAALLSWIQQYAPYGVITLDESFQVQSWNHWMELHSRMRFEQVAGKSLFALFPDLNDRKLAGHFERALEGETSVLSTALHRYLLPLPSPFRETGIALMLQTARLAPLFSESKVCGIVVVIEDVTQRESQAQALSQQHRRDELLSWALAHFLRTEQPRKEVRQLFFKIAEQLDFDTFLVYVRDTVTGEIRLDAVGGLPIESEKDFLACPFLALFDGETNEPVVMNAVQALPESQCASPLKKAHISALVAIPLVANHKSLGLLVFASWSRDSITPDEVDLVNTIAKYLATALDRENTAGQLRHAKELLSERAQGLEKSVQERTARLRETISELETFSYTIAHDLRAPARGMTGYCEVMLEDFANELSPDARLVIQKIARAAKRMEALTHDLLEFTKVSRQEIVLTSVEIEPIIEDLKALGLPDVHKALTIRSPLLPVRAHRGLLQHVFSNLVDNAMKFVPPATTPKITISSEIVPHGSPNTRSNTLTFSSTDATPEQMAPPLQPSAEYVRIWVRDEGIGIPREAQQKIFGIFERGTTSASYEGTGMGLAIVARAMQRMGGTCGVESELGQGSSFWLELPAA